MSSSISPKQLKKMLSKSSKIEEISLVIIELPNCDPFAKILIDLGVANVLTFSIPLDDELSSSDSDNDQQQIKQYHQNRINEVKSYMNSFCFSFYKLIGNEKIKLQD